MTAAAETRADFIAARVTGLGVGLIVFMLTWSIGARVTEALLAGAITTVRVGCRLGRFSANGGQHAIPASLRTD